MSGKEGGGSHASHPSSQQKGRPLGDPPGHGTGMASPMSRECPGLGGGCADSAWGAARSTPLCPPCVSVTVGQAPHLPRREGLPAAAGRGANHSGGPCRARQCAQPHLWTIAWTLPSRLRGRWLWPSQGDWLGQARSKIVD